MAVLWQQHRDGVLYEVRSAGRTRRLYTDGVFHSQYNPAHVLTGSVWDLLLLPAFFADPGSLRRVLVLGVGGGAVIHQLRYFFDSAAIVGVELADVHLQVAREYFQLGGEGIDLECAEAREWVHNYRGERFDLIIDDLFGEDAGEPVRAVAADAEWFAALDQLLNSKGILVMNFLSRGELTHCGYFHSRVQRGRFKSAFQLTTDFYVNYVGAFLKQPGTAQQLRARVMRRPLLRRAAEQGRLRYRIRKL